MGGRKGGLSGSSWEGITAHVRTHLTVVVGQKQGNVQKGRALMWAALS